MFLIAMLDLAGLDTGDISFVDLGLDLLITDRLDGDVVVVLVDLTIDDLLPLFVFGPLDVFLYDGRVDGFVDRGVCLTIFTQEGGDVLLGLAGGVSVRGVVGVRIGGLSVELHSFFLDVMD